jgi:hypothetical protein
MTAPVISAFASLAALAALFIQLTIANRMPHVVDNLGLVNARADPWFATTGVTDGGIQTRLEIRELQTQQPDLFNLYLLGLARFQRMPQDDRLSYYQVAGTYPRYYGDSADLHSDPWPTMDLMGRPSRRRRG